jgi:hydrogenase maturation factor
MSRLHRVVRAMPHGGVEVEDVDGARHVVSLLALDGPAPVPGEWLTVHSGYAIDRVDAVEARAVQAEIRAHGRDLPGEHEGEYGS